MNSKATLFFTIALIALCAFTAGYWLGTEKTLKQLDSQEHGRFTKATFPKTQSGLTEGEISSKTISNNMLQISSDNELKEANGKQTNQTKPNEQSNRLVLKTNATVIEMMEFLLLVGLSENADDVNQFGPTLDLLRDVVSENPDKMQMLVDYFVDSDGGSQAPYYITSVLQGADIQDKDILIKNMVSRLSLQGTSNANKKLLHLVSNTGAHHNNEEIVETLKNIALFSHTDDNNRTYALDLLMPYQLSTDEKLKVVTDLSYALEQAPSEDRTYMVESIIRFSDKENRTNLASNYLADTNEFTTRLAILSTLHTGSIKPNQSLKKTLFTIAQNSDDPLNKHAKDTLMYVFELSNDEYNRLRSGN